MSRYQRARTRERSQAEQLDLRLEYVEAVTISKRTVFPGNPPPLRKGPLLMHRIPVSSVDITQVGYQEDSEILEIEFSRGEVCQFFNVPATVYDELMQSPSKEQYYHAKIGERFPCSRIK